jgi:hypothetical protein
LKQVKKRTAKGTDAWSLEEALSIPECILDLIAWVFTEVEAGGDWPPSLTYAVVPLLPKGEGSDQPLKQRPITILSLWYRVYDSLRFRDMVPWMLKWLPVESRGGAPDMETADISLEVSLDLELARGSKVPLFGANLDEVKCFDSVARQQTFEAASAHGAPKEITDSQFRFYEDLERVFRFGNSVGGWWGSETSIAHGSALSVIWINLRTAMWVTYVHSKVEDVALSVFIDDRSIRSWIAERVRDALAATTQYDEAVGAQTHPGKTQGWTTGKTVRQRAHLRTFVLMKQIISTSDAEKVLGVHHFYKGGISKDVQAVRADRCVEVAEKIRYLPRDFQTKAKLAATVAIPAFGFGAEYIPPSAQDVDRCRKALTRACWGDQGTHKAVELVWTIAL